MILETITEATKKRVREQKLKLPLTDMIFQIYNTDSIRSFHNRKDFAFENALKGEEMSYICEVKKASPSKGIIAKEFPYLRIAKEYEAAGASAISVLTEPDYFLGKNEYLTEISQAVNIPVLRKDFIIDEYQIYEAKILGADAVLLICSLLDADTLQYYLKICNRLGLSALVEAHTEDEIEVALKVGASLIGVNNRNLKTFEVNLERSIRLRSMVPGTVIFVAESGISTREDIRLLKDNGVNAVLIGETLMKSERKKELLQQLGS